MIRYKNREWSTYDINADEGFIIDNITGKRLPAKIINGYKFVSIDKNYIPVHCIIAHTFYGFRPGKVIHHINHKKTDNRICNLNYEMNEEEHLCLHKKEYEKRHPGEKFITRKEILEDPYFFTHMKRFPLKTLDEIFDEDKN